jgi:hypothetical protein
MTPLRVAIADHQGKSHGLAAALLRAGHALVDDLELADAVLIDHDLPSHGKLPAAEACVASGGRAFVYPHGGGITSVLGWDGIHPVATCLTGALVIGPGHAEVMRRYGYPHPVHPIGWSLCGLRERATTGRVENVLFAAGHPPGDGDCHDDEKRANETVLRRLVATPARVIVRHLGTLAENGLPRLPDVEYHRGDLFGFDEMIAQIDAADVVVGDLGTFSSLAVARGRTTVTWGCDDLRPDAQWPAHLDDYLDYVKFPFDLGDGDAWDVLRAAVADTEQIGEWRARFVGEALAADRLAEVLAGGAADRARARDPRRLHRAALRLVERGALAEAAAVLEEATATVDEPAILNDLAVVTWSLGRPDEACALLQRCLDVDPGNADALENLTALGAAAAAA